MPPRELDTGQLDRLLAELRDPDHRVREAAADALGESDDRRAVPALIAALDDEYASESQYPEEARPVFHGYPVREAAARALGRIADPASIPALVERLVGAGDWSGQNARDAEMTLRAIATAPGPDSEMRQRREEVIRYVTPLLKERPGAAGRVLSEIGDPAALQALIDAAEREEVESGGRQYLLDAIAQIGGPDAAQFLDSYRQQLQRQRREAEEERERQALDPTFQTAALVDAARNSDWKTRDRAAKNLVRLGSSAVPTLVAALSDPTLEVRWSAAEVLGRIGDRSAVDALAKLLDDVEDAVRDIAEQGLEALGGPDAERRLASYRAGQP